MKTTNVSNKVLMWRVDWKVSKKPVPVIMLGEGEIKVVGRCRISQPLIDSHESYHATEAEAIQKLLENATNDVAMAKHKLKLAKDRLKRLAKKYPLNTQTD